MSYEYKVVPAPVRGVKAKGVKTPEERFAHALEAAMNELAADGWEYLRADTLPCEQRDGLMSKTTVFQNLLIFRRSKGDAQDASGAPLMIAARNAQGGNAPAVKGPVSEAVLNDVAPVDDDLDDGPTGIADDEPENDKAKDAV